MSLLLSEVGVVVEFDESAARPNFNDGKEMRLAGVYGASYLLVWRMR